MYNTHHQLDHAVQMTRKDNYDNFSAYYIGEEGLADHSSLLR